MLRTSRSSTGSTLICCLMMNGKRYHSAILTVAANYHSRLILPKPCYSRWNLRLKIEWVEEREEWKGLQVFSHRRGNFRDDTETALLSLGYPLDWGREKSSKQCPSNRKEFEDDFQYIYFRFKVLKEHANNLMQAMTGLGSSATSRQNKEEVKRMKLLNLLYLPFCLYRSPT